VKKSVWLGLLFVAVVVGFVVYSTLNTGRIRCKVCITYRGQQACRTAAGVTDSNQCNNTPPDSVRWP